MLNWVGYAGLCFIASVPLWSKQPYSLEAETYLFPFDYTESSTELTGVFLQGADAGIL